MDLAKPSNFKTNSNSNTEQDFGHNHLSKFTLIGALMTLGIVFGDIGTSPLYVMKAIISTNSHNITREFIIGALSCVIWTLTLQTTVKYVLITLRADNKGEGGILALYSLVRKIKPKKLYIIAIIGASTLIADGVITPSLTVISAIEGLEILHSHTPVVPITLAILCSLFLIQQLGTNFVGKFFGPVMIVWFLMLAILGIAEIHYVPEVLYAFNPYYAVKLLIQFPHALLILGAVFLCTTGAEALYSDLGHCGIRNIQASWAFVKTCLILNYLGQGTWILSNVNAAASGQNPFFELMPTWFLIPGIIIATMAAIVASQALITGSFSIFSEAMSLNFWPRQKIIYPSQVKGQMYIPWVNWSLLIMCTIVVLYFKESAKMDAAYGLSITVTMISTTLLLLYYLNSKKYPLALIALFGSIFLFIEGGFFYANLLKFFEGGWLTVLLAGSMAIMMGAWHGGRRLKNKYVQYVKVAPYLSIIKDVSLDESIPKYATNLVYISRANRHDEIESKIIYSLINKQPKRADYYWFLHVENDTNPYTFEYHFVELIPDTLFRLYFKLGFKVQPMVNVYFQQVLEDLEKTKEINVISNYPSLSKYNIPADFKYILIDRVFDHDYMLPFRKRIILKFYNFLKYAGIADTVALGLEMHNCEVEKTPIITDISYKKRIKRCQSS